MKEQGRKSPIVDALNNEEGQGVYIGGGALLVIVLIVLLILLL